MKTDRDRIEIQLNDFLSRRDAPFSLADAVEAIATAVALPATVIRDEIESELNNSEHIFRLPDSMFATYRSLFNGGLFRVMPSEIEIRNGILIPGHRFLPFCHPDLFPSDFRVTSGDTKRAIRARSFPMRLGDITSSHVLMGTDEMLDYLCADSGERSILFGDADPNLLLSVTVLDLSNQYKKRRTRLGDSLVFRVNDWETGAFTLLPPEKIPNSVEFPQESWWDEFGDSLAEVIDEFGDYLSIPEQIAMAFARGNRNLLAIPSSDVETAVARSGRFQIRHLDGQSMLCVCDDIDGRVEREGYPPDIMISRGTMGSLDEILNELGVSLNSNEIRKIMRTEFDSGERSLDEVILRHIGSDLPFADDAQEAEFQNQLEDLWEKIAGDEE
jgi:hypothetical protein